MRIGFTGSRAGMTWGQKEMFIAQLMKLSPSEFHHGDCLGADSDAHKLVREVFPTVKIVLHPPIAQKFRAFCPADETMRELDFLERNKEIVNCSDVLIACPSGPEQLRSGTWSTVRYAKKSNCPVRILDWNLK